MDQYREVLLSSLPQNLDIIQLEGFKISIGKWLLSNEGIEPQFLILTTQESWGIPFGFLFIQAYTNNWIPYDLIEQEAPHPNFCRVRVCTKSNITGQILDFNPINFPDLSSQSTWLYRKGYIYTLDFDPKEWNWKKLGELQETPFFNYQTKRGYRQTCLNYSTTSPYDKELQRFG